MPCVLVVLVLLAPAAWAQEDEERLAFFPADQAAEKPEYELGMLLLDNGVSRDMTIDYGDYSIKAKLAIARERAGTQTPRDR